ncbi:MAG: hypothetical protein FWH04_09960 [Oscillospiraceae bacterium]|nr:hypothetical protein [Oscillospiraceae bacterium]
MLERHNVELLKLIALCKNFPAEFQYPESHIFSGGNVERLQKEKLVYETKDKRHCCVTPLGYDLLNHIGINIQPDRSHVSRERIVSRREQSGQVMATLMMAGVDVFADDVSQLLNPRSYMTASYIRKIQRSKGQNVSGNARFTGLMGNSVFFYVSDPEARLYHKNEINTAEIILAQSGRNTPVGRIPCVIDPCVIYMGTDYHALCASVTGPAGKKAAYRTAYDKFTQPLHLCPCNPDGAFQMRIMLQPNYRKRLNNLIFGENGLAPPRSGYEASDGMMNNEPVILGIDMNLRRISKLISKAREHSTSTHIFVRDCQGEAIRGLYPENDICLYRIEDEEIMRLFSFPEFLDEPGCNEPYITKEGGYISDETVRICREARRAGYKKSQTD